VVAEQLRASFADAAADVDGCPVYATVSIGLVIDQEGPVEISTLLAQADQALYCAKQRGRNRVEIASLDIVREPALAVFQPARDVSTKSAA
jgi:diguanylate cyclase (GGDEF)-like protein